MESARLCRWGEPCACAIDHDHGNLRPFTPGRVLQRSDGLDGPANFTARQARFRDMDRCDGCIDRGRRCGSKTCAASRGGSHRTFGADEFSCLDELSGRLDAVARAGTGPTRADQRQRGAKNARRGCVAGGPGAVFVTGWALPNPCHAHCARRRRRLFAWRGGLEAAGQRGDWREQQRRAARLGRRIEFPLRQDSSGAVQRIRAVEELAHLCGRLNGHHR